MLRPGLATRLRSQLTSWASTRLSPLLDAVLDALLDPPTSVRWRARVSSWVSTRWRALRDIALDALLDPPTSVRWRAQLSAWLRSRLSDLASVRRASPGSALLPARPPWAPPGRRRRAARPAGRSVLRPTLAVASLLLLVPFVNVLGTVTGLVRHPLAGVGDSLLGLAPEPPAKEPETPDPAVALAAGFDELRSRTGARSLGLAYAPLGDPTVVQFGDWRTGPAWSTIKVPLSVAALRNSRSDEVASLVHRAVTVSDNQAAVDLWRSLGGNGTAPAAVDAVLIGHGDLTTRTALDPRAEAYLPFGLTRWALTDQVTFAASLYCAEDDGLPDGDVVQEMARISAGQRWGLGRLSGATFKGGWGPDRTGHYLVRQFGIVTLAGQPVAVAVAVEPGDGSFVEGTQVLDQVAAWLADSVTPAPSSCPGG